MIKPVKIAVVGCGMISNAYLSTMKSKFKILDLVACCDLDAEKAQRAAQKYGIKALTMEEVLSDETIEIVVNLTTPNAHYPVIKRLLEGGKHVYTEKILTVELDQAAELLKIADQKGLYLGAAPDTFLGSAIQTARYVVDSGMLGEITSCFCALSRDHAVFVTPHSFTIKPGGGIGFDVGIYYITALLSILGPVREVSGIVRTVNPKRELHTLENFGETVQVQCEDLMAGTLIFERGTVGTALFDYNSVMTLPERPSMVLFGTMGVMYMADPNNFGGEVKVILKGNNEPAVMPQSHAYSAECRGLGVAEMAWSLRLGRKNRANKEMAYHALDVLDGIVRSSQTKTSQAIQSTFEMMPPLPRGFVGQGYFEQIEENGIAL